MLHCCPVCVTILVSACGHALRRTSPGETMWSDSPGYSNMSGAATTGV